MGRYEQPHAENVSAVSTSKFNLVNLLEESHIKHNKQPLQPNYADLSLQSCIMGGVRSEARRRRSRLLPLVSAMLHLPQVNQDAVFTTYQFINKLTIGIVNCAIAQSSFALT